MSHMGTRTWHLGTRTWTRTRKLVTRTWTRTCQLVTRLQLWGHDLFFRGAASEQE